MTTATQQTLLERFNSLNGNWQEERRFKVDLEHLLNAENEGFLSPSGKTTLAEYRENFDWDTSYWVSFNWDISSSYTSSQKCENLAELQAYLKGDKEYPTTDDLEKEDEYWRDGIDTDIYEVSSSSSSVSVSNIRIKEKVNQYSIVLSVESKEDKEYIKNNVLKYFEEAIQKIHQGPELTIKDTGEVIQIN